MYIVDGIINLLCETTVHWTTRRNYITVVEESLVSQLLHFLLLTLPGFAAYPG